MRFRCFKVGCEIALLSSASLLLVRGAEPDRKTVTPDTGLSATLTNLSRSTPKKDGLELLEEELSRSLQPFSPRSSLDSILTPRYLPPPVVAPNRRPTNDAEKSRNWLLNNESDLGRTSQDPFKSLQNSTKTGGWDELLRSLDGQRQDKALGAAKPDASKRQSLKPLDDQDDEDLDLPSGLRESAKSLRDTLLGSDSIFNRRSSQSGVRRLFAPPEESALSREQIEAHQEYMERFRQTLDLPAARTASAQDPLKSKLELTTSSSKSAYTPPSALSPTTRRDTFASTPAAAESLLRPTTIPDPNERTLNQWNPLYTRPAPVERSRPVPFASPALDIPRRKF